MTTLSTNTKYYKEAFNLLKQCSKADDRQDLSNKVFEELISETTDILKVTRACSRELEEFLPHVTSHTILCSYFIRLTETKLDELIRDRAGCFLFEKLFVYLPNCLSNENEQMCLAFERVFECVCENFNDYIAETGPSHIIGSTISFLHPLLKSCDDNEYEQLIDAGRTAKKFLEHSSEWNITDKLRRIGKLIKKCEIFNEFVYATYLRTCGYVSTKLYEKFLKLIFEKYYSNINYENLLDKRSSFIFEVLLEQPSEQRDNIIYPLIIDNIEEFYLHPIGNYLLQHLLLTLNEMKYLTNIYQFIIKNEIFDKFIQSSHIRLLITFIRICERYNCHYDQFINQLNIFIKSKTDENKNFILSLLSLRSENSETQSITKDGSLVVQALLRAEKVDNLTRHAFLSLSGEEISTIACHPSGSHLLCQLILKSTLWPVLKQKNFYNKLEKFYTKISCDKAGCWFITQLWKNATTIEQKIVMASNMSNDFQTLRSHMYAKFITYEMNLVAFCSRPEQWKRSIEINLKKHALLDDLESENNNKNTNKKKKKKK